MVARVWLNPDIAGVTPAERGSWQNSAWHRSLLTKDPQRVAYIDEVKAWDAVFVKSVRDFFMGSKTAAVALPSLPGLR